MTDFLIQEAASHRIDEIYRYTLTNWGKEQADSYIEGILNLLTRF